MKKNRRLQASKKIAALQAQIRDLETRLLALEAAGLGVFYGPPYPAPAMPRYTPFETPQRWAELTCTVDPFAPVRQTETASLCCGSSIE